jgi:hypothetical protein
MDIGPDRVVKMGEGAEPEGLPQEVGSRRLTAVAPDLVRLLQDAPVGDLRRVAGAVSRFASTVVELNDPRIDLALEAVDAGQAEDYEPDDVIEIAEGLDAEARAVEDQDGRSVATHDTVSRRAHAAWSVVFALEVDAKHAALEAVYEAQAATRDIDAVRTVVEEIVSPRR